MLDLSEVGDNYLRLPELGAIKSNISISNIWKMSNITNKTAARKCVSARKNDSYLRNYLSV